MGCENGNSMKSSSSPSDISAPLNLHVLAGYPAVTLIWNDVTEADHYNLYLSTQSGVSPVNWSQLTEGKMIRDVKSPYLHERSYKDVTYYYIVTAIKNGNESAPSVEVSDPNVYIFDDFERPDQQLGGIALTGQPWRASGPGSLTYGLINGGMVTSQNVYPRIDYFHHNFRFGVKFSFVNLSNCSIVLIADASVLEAALRDMVHLQLLPTGWGLIFRADRHVSHVAMIGASVFSYPFNSLTTQDADVIVRVNGSVKTSNVDYVVTGIGDINGGTVVFNHPMIGGEVIEIRTPGPFENIIGGNYNLLTDGTIYTATMTIINDTVTLELPDGTIQNTRDSRIQDLSGNTLLWQLTSTGCRNESVFATPMSN